MTDKELKDWLTGFALCAYITPHPIPQREPVAFLYGRVAKEGETPTHTIDGVDYVGAVTTDIQSVYTPELQQQFPHAHVAYRLNQLEFPVLVLTDTPIVTGYKTYMGYQILQVVSQDGSTGEVYKYSSDNQWVHHADIDASHYYGNPASYAVWSNHAILNEDGTPHLDETETVKIPIYE